MTIREGRWDCQYCGATGIRGRHKVCPNCARSRPEGTTFYIPEDEKEVTEASLVAEAEKGADWICAFCSSSNPADLAVCRHCDAPREDTSAQQEVKTYGVGEAPRSGDMDLDAPPPSRPQPTPTKAKRPAGLMVVAIFAGVIILAFLCGGFFLLRSSDETVMVEQFEWERDVEVEAYLTVEEEDWLVPEGGRQIDSRREVRRYDQKLIGYDTVQREVAEEVQVGTNTYVCGQRDLGNGFFEDIMCSEPVYETRYRTETEQVPIYENVPVYDTLYIYEIDKWVDEFEWVTASGMDQDPYWPEANLAANEREGTRSEEYLIVFVSEDGETYTMEFSLDEWLAFEMNTAYELRVNALGNPVEISP
jgi:hypothetical protein